MRETFFATVDFPCGDVEVAGMACSLVGLLASLEMSYLWVDFGATTGRNPFIEYCTSTITAVNSVLAGVLTRYPGVVALRRNDAF